MRRVLTYLLAVLGVVATVTLVPVSGSAPAGSASAADLSFFDPGNIVSDAVFYDYLSMNAADVQSFLTAKGANCTSGAYCLKNYTQTTTDQPADSRCPATYAGAANESAATIITKVAVACRISPRSLLVTLQKESGLVTAKSPSSSTYTFAMGYGCPDSTGCTSNSYPGFFSQVYHAAHAFQSYRVNPDGYTWAAGVTNQLPYNPKASCGTKPVYIVNQATAGLYDYTPYVPNAAALAAGYGEGDGCSAYGNRNFWNYFTDWFGSTQSTGGGAIYSYYQSSGGATGQYGSPASSFLCGLANGGCFQRFQNGYVYWSPATGAHGIIGALGASWVVRGYETGPLGYPVGDAICGLGQGGCFQDFQGGSLYWSSSTGAHLVRGAIRTKWSQLGWEAGWLGYPMTDETCGLRNGGCFNHFQGGSVYYSPATGAQAVNSGIQLTWSALGWENGSLGYPTGDTFCGLPADGCGQDFQGASLYWSASTGTHVLRGITGTIWKAAGTAGGWLGYPTADEVCGLKNAGCFQSAQNGSVYWSPATGGFGVPAAILAGWGAVGWEAGVLGYPVSLPRCGLSAGGCAEGFQGGAEYSSPATGAHFVRGLVQAKWNSTGAEGGWMGYPTTDETCGLRGGGCFNAFQGGSVYWSPATGAFPVYGAIRDAWSAQGWETGRWGYPAGDPQTSGSVTTQRFQGGTVSYDSATQAVSVR